MLIVIRFVLSLYCVSIHLWISAVISVSPEVFSRKYHFPCNLCKKQHIYEHFLCHSPALRHKCRKKIDLKSQKIATQRVTIEFPSSPWKNVSFKNSTLRILIQSHKITPKWLLMVKKLSLCKERRKWGIDWTLNMKHWIYWDRAKKERLWNVFDGMTYYN